MRRSGIAWVRGAGMASEQFAMLCSIMGRPAGHPFLPKAGQVGADSTVVMKRPRDRVGSYIYGGAWHQNLTFLDEPPEVTVLCAIEINDLRNFTAFVDLTEVSPWYSDGIKALLGTTRALHSTNAPDSPQNRLQTSNMPAGADRLTESWHPAMIRDSELDAEWPFVMSNYVTNLEGWHPREANPLIKSLYEFMQHDEFVIRHYWAPGDLVAWDNLRMAHRATVTHKVGNRQILRNDLVCGWDRLNLLGI